MSFVCPFQLSVFLQASISIWIRTTMACWAKRSCHVTAQRRSPPSSWTACFRSVSPTMEKWCVKLAARLSEPFSWSTCDLSHPKCLLSNSRTIRPILTLSWLWKTGRSRQRFSIFLNFWTLRTKDTSMSSPSTFSSGYRLHFVLSSTITACKDFIVFIPRCSTWFYFTLCSSGHSRADEAPWTGTRVLPGCEGALTKQTKQAWLFRCSCKLTAWPFFCS